MDDLKCKEQMDFDDIDDDLNLDSKSIKSFVDPNLLHDRRVLENILLGHNVQKSVLRDNYFKTVQTEIKPHMRKIVCEWMLEVTEEQRCQPEVFSLAVDYMDRFLSRVPLAKSQFQLLACVCIFLASKFKESFPLCADKLVIYTDFSVTSEEITRWELLVLQVLDWDLSAVTPYCILDQLLRRVDFSECSMDGAVIRRHSETFISLVATELDLQAGLPAGLLAISCLIAAVNGLKQTSEQSHYLAKLLSVMSEISSHSQSDIVKAVDNVEAVMKERLPQPRDDEVPTPTNANSSSSISSSPNATTGTSPANNPPISVY